MENLGEKMTKEEIECLINEIGTILIREDLLFDFHFFSPRY